MRIDFIARITDDNGNVVECPVTVDADLPAVDCFDNKEQFLSQFDSYEKALLQARNEAAEAVTDAYLQAAAKKNSRKA